MAEFDGAPPSTLAAQLIEDYDSSMGKSSRPDEMSEIKAFFPIIQSAQQNPSIIVTDEQRLDHNHMLIYVVTILLLNDKQKDALAGLEGRRLTLNVVACINATITDTPRVLSYVAPPGTFLARGSEPLWLWLFPKLLSVVGQPQGEELDAAIYNILQLRLDFAMHHGGLWVWAQSFNQYLRGIFESIIQQAKPRSQAGVLSSRVVSIILPPAIVIDSLMDRQSISLAGVTYSIHTVIQALTQARVILSVLMHSLQSRSAMAWSMPFVCDAPQWVLSALKLYESVCSVCNGGSVQKAMETATFCTQKIIDVITSHHMTYHAADSLHQMYTITLVFEASKLSQHILALLSTSTESYSTMSYSTTTLATAFIAISRAVRKADDGNLSSMVRSQLVVVFRNPIGNEELKNGPEMLDSDLRLCYLILERTCDLALSSSKYPDDLHFSKIQSSTLRAMAKDLGLEYDRQAPEPPAKKRKIVQSEELKIINEAAAPLFHALGVDYEASILDVPQLFHEVYPKADDNKQCRIIAQLGLTGCLVDSCASCSDVDAHHKRSLHEIVCKVCNGGDDSTRPPEQNAALKDSMITLFKDLTERPDFQASTRPRIVAMISMRRLMLHCTNTDFLVVGTSKVGQWCVSCLDSDVRELRIAASRTLGVFMQHRPWLKTDIPQRNVDYIISVLGRKSLQAEPTHTESCIIAWGITAVHADDEALVPVLLKLLEYFTTSNELTWALVYNEVINIAVNKKLPMKEILQPYWPKLTYFIVKNLVDQPVVLDRVASILRVSVNTFLKHTQPYSMPWLVLNQKFDVIQAMCKRILGGEAPVSQMFTNSNETMAAVLALLISEDVINAEKTVNNLFSQLGIPETLESIAQHSAFHLTIELFYLAADGDDKCKAQVRDALELIVRKRNIRRAGHSSNSTDAIGKDLESFLLGLVNFITHPMTPASPAYSLRRSLRALQQVIATCKSYTRIARPQLSTCFISCLEQPKVRAVAFECWCTLVTCMSEEDVAELMEPTFFNIIHGWENFNHASRHRARDLIRYIGTQHQELVRQMGPRLPSLSSLQDEEMAKLDATFRDASQASDSKSKLMSFVVRLRHENSGVAMLAARELNEWLNKDQEFVQTSVLSPEPDEVVGLLVRALLDCAANTNLTRMGSSELSRLCNSCLGQIGCIDSNQVELLHKEPETVVVSNFKDPNELVDFVLFLLENVMLPIFLSSRNVSDQDMFSWIIQEMLRVAGIRKTFLETGEAPERWTSLPHASREQLSVFLKSDYTLGPLQKTPTAKFPLFPPEGVRKMDYRTWLRALTTCLFTAACASSTSKLLPVLRRSCQYTTVASFVVPYLFVFVVVGEASDGQHAELLLAELQAILGYQCLPEASYAEKEEMKLYYNLIFRIFDYALRWLQRRKTALGQSLAPDFDAIIRKGGQRLEKLLDGIDKQVLARRAADCGDFPRALFSLEMHINQQQEKCAPKTFQTPQGVLDAMLEVYANIDDPDGIDGILSQFATIDIDQQILSHRKAGRWTAAQSWYEIKLAEQPSNVYRQLDLLNCLKESGQYDVLLNHVNGIKRSPQNVGMIAPLAFESFWATGRWDSLEQFLGYINPAQRFDNFDVGVAEILSRLRAGDRESTILAVQSLRDRVAGSMSQAVTLSLRSAHEPMLQSHILVELEMIAGLDPHYQAMEGQQVLTHLVRRLDVLGSYVNDKQYTLGVRRAAMEIMGQRFTKRDISNFWLTSAKIARKAGATAQAFSAVLRASRLGDERATIENARLLWNEGHNRKAIQMLEKAIERNGLKVQDAPGQQTSTTVSHPGYISANILAATANLLLAKWISASNQGHYSAQKEKYAAATAMYPSWEKAHYYLGRHYKKLLDSEQLVPPTEQTEHYVTGQAARLVIENYVRALSCGTKYIYQTLPRVLTLWLDLGATVSNDSKTTTAVPSRLREQRRKNLDTLHAFLDRRISNTPAFVWYTVLFQTVARIAHPNSDVFQRLELVILKVLRAFPRQAFWAIFPVITRKGPKGPPDERQLRGASLLGHIKGSGTGSSSPTGDLARLLRMSGKLASQLLEVCKRHDFRASRTVHVSITREFRFNHNCLPCPLVVPVQRSLVPRLPIWTENAKQFRVFADDVVTLQSFKDDVMVLGSLARPRRVTCVGSNGKEYDLLLKPSDDLRTDQRLMEFNGTVNRALKRDAESSRRQLYVKTYAVTPISEACGIIEWVDGLRTLRDILLRLYRDRGVTPNYNILQQQLDNAAMEGNEDMWSRVVLPQFPPVLATWFVSQFPSPSAWFAARLCYMRSTAVMSMLGTILGLGDRHGENVLLEEDNGGVFHVDFNCLFDKGRTFQKPERVPFRLTHNMVHAMGVQGYEGAFRASSELTLRVLRQQEETLMSILEAFIYDPTLDLQKESKDPKDRHKKANPDHPDMEPGQVVLRIKKRIRGMMPPDTIPLSVEGQVDELIKQAVSHANLVKMYIGWCPFL